MPYAFFATEKIGVGKTTIFNKICDASRSTDLGSYSTTRTYAKHKIFYQGNELVIFDGPGCKSKRDTYQHSYVMRHGLTYEPLNAIFIFVEYNTRIGSNMTDDFWEVAKMLKPEYLQMVVLMVTKMDHFEPEGSFQSKEDMQDHISDIFAKDFDVNRVVFSERNINKESLFNRMYSVVHDLPAVQLEYSETEFLSYFELKAWKGREMHDLYRTKTLVQGLTSEFLEGLSDLEENRTEYSDAEFQDCVFGAIQQSNRELQAMVIEPFVTRNSNSQHEFEDYAAYIELQKIVLAAHSDVRNAAKHLLPINPDDTSNWRNALRRCQYCGEVWVRVEGCDGETTCGLIPQTGDPYGDESYISYTWAIVSGKRRPNKINKRKQKARAVSLETAVASTKQVGCGKTIVWKDQALVSITEVDELFNTQDLQQILGSLGMKADFVAKKNKVEETITVFSKLDEDGKDVDP